MCTIWSSVEKIYQLCDCVVSFAPVIIATCTSAWGCNQLKTDVPKYYLQVGPPSLLEVSKYLNALTVFYNICLKTLVRLFVIFAILSPISRSILWYHVHCRPTCMSEILPHWGLGSAFDHLKIKSSNFGVCTPKMIQLKSFKTKFYQL